MHRIQLDAAALQGCAYSDDLNLQSITSAPWWPRIECIVAARLTNGRLELKQCSSKAQAKCKALLLSYMGFNEASVGQTLDIYHHATRRDRHYLLLARPNPPVSTKTQPSAADRAIRPQEKQTDGRVHAAPSKNVTAGGDASDPHSTRHARSDTHAAQGDKPSAPSTQAQPDDSTAGRGVQTTPAAAACTSKRAELRQAPGLQRVCLKPSSTHAAGSQLKQAPAGHHGNANGAGTAAWLTVCVQSLACLPFANRQPVLRIRASTIPSKHGSAWLRRWPW